MSQKEMKNQKISDKAKNFFRRGKSLVWGHKKLAALFLVLFLGYLGWRLFSPRQETPEFQTATAQRGMMVASVSASGQVLSVNVMAATTKASGIVKTVYVQDGDQVKKGDKILEISLDSQGQQKNAQAYAAYLSAKNSLESAETSLYTLQSQAFAANQKLINDAVARELAADDPTYIQENADWLAAEAKYKSQAAVISQARLALNNNWLSYQLTSPIITAPTDGVITSLMFVPGMSIGSLDTGNTESNQKVATVETGGTPIVSVNLSEIDVSRVVVGQKTTIILDSLPEQTFTGKVMGVDRLGQTSSGVTQYPAIIQLDSSSAKILPNMAATANIILDQKDSALWVPAAAVQTQDGQSLVRVLVGQKTQFVPVETGLVSDTQVEIVSGLNEGEVVVTGSALTTGQSGEGSPFGSSFGGAMRLAR